MGGAYLDGDPKDSPDFRADPNTVDSPFAGVGSLGINGVFVASAVVISPTHILTAAHVVDQDFDGVADVAPETLEFHLNAGGDSTSILGIVEIALHPDYTGFNNPALNDDLAVLALATPVPAEGPGVLPV